MAIHKDLTGETAIHPFSYKQSSDPGAVGANKGWIDTTTGPPYQLKVRNAANTAWETVGTTATVSAASETVSGIVELATQTETNTGTDTLRVTTPATVAGRTATETRSGGLEIATQGETDAGTDDTRAVTPLKLATYSGFSGAVPDASETVKGKIEIATQTETNTGTDDVRAVTPLKLKTFGDARYIVNSGGLGTTIDLDNLGDVTVPSPSDGDVLTYDSGTSTWVNEVPTGGGSSGAGAVGWTPFALPVGGSHAQSFINNFNVAANGGAVAIPIQVIGQLRCEFVKFINGDSGSTRGPVEIALYLDDPNNSNTLSLVTDSVGTLSSFTGSSGAIKSVPITAGVVDLDPGIYWLALKNNHASNTLAIEVTNSPGSFTTESLWQSKTLTTSAFGSTLDFVAATWTKQTSAPGVRLAGRVFGQTSIF